MLVNARNVNILQSIFWDLSVDGTNYVFCFCVDINIYSFYFFFFSSRRRHTRCSRDWSSDVCSSDLDVLLAAGSIGLSTAELSETAAIAALAPRHLVVTDSERWASIELPDSDDHAAVEVLHDRLVPEFPHGDRKSVV